MQYNCCCCCYYYFIYNDDFFYGNESLQDYCRVMHEYENISSSVVVQRRQPVVCAVKAEKI